MEKNSITNGILNILLVIIILLVLVTIGCTPKYPNISRPTKREIRRAMKYSTSEYYDEIPTSTVFTGNLKFSSNHILKGMCHLSPK